MHPRERGGKTNCHLVRALLNKAPNALRTPCDTPKWIVSSLTMTGKLDNPALSHRPSWTLSTDATSFIDVGKHSVCITNTHHSADPALLPPPHRRGNHGSPLPTAEGTVFLLGSAEISVQTRLDVFLSDTYTDICVPFFSFTWVQPVAAKSWCEGMMYLSCRKDQRRN